jgi:hypothetical protein
MNLSAGTVHDCMTWLLEIFCVHSTAEEDRVRFDE